MIWYDMIWEEYTYSFSLSVNKCTYFFYCRGNGDLLRQTELDDARERVEGWGALGPVVEGGEGVDFMVHPVSLFLSLYLSLPYTLW